MPDYQLEKDLAEESQRQMNGRLITTTTTTRRATARWRRCNSPKSFLILFPVLRT
jgi:hypothetical protein